jgi:hypothetical protein
MPTFAGTNRDFQILIAALPGGGGISKRDLELAAKLREGLIKQLAQDNERPEMNFTPLPASWPTGFVQPGKKEHWNWTKPSKVKLNNSTTQAEIDKVLEGLI